MVLFKKKKNLTCNKIEIDSRNNFSSLKVQERVDGEAPAAAQEVAARDAEPVEPTVEVQQSQQVNSPFDISKYF